MVQAKIQGFLKGTMSPLEKGAFENSNSSLYFE